MVFHPLLSGPHPSYPFLFLSQKQNRHPYGYLFCLAERKGFPPALGQCRRQPGVLKNHSLDGFSPASERAAPFVSLPLFIPKTKQTPLWVSVLFGGEKGIRTLEYIPALHDFQLAKRVHRIPSYNTKNPAVFRVFQCHNIQLYHII